jgi:hypothetical protein
MNGRFQMQVGKNWILPKGDECKPVLLGLSFAGNLVKPLRLRPSMRPNGGNVAMVLVINKIPPM